MLRVAALALLVSLAAASTLGDLMNLLRAGGEFNEINENDIQLYKQCNDLEKFDDRIMGWWKGRSQVSADEYIKDYDIHFIKSDGTGVVNRRSSTDNTKIVMETPSKMWCKTEPNQVDKVVKVQYGPTVYGQIICVNLQVPNDKPKELEVQVNQVLFTDPRVPMKFPVALDCLNYPYQSKFNSYTVWADQLSNPSSEMWTRSSSSENNDWVTTDEKKSALKDLLRLLTY